MTIDEANQIVVDAIDLMPVTSTKKAKVLRDIILPYPPDAARAAIIENAKASESVSLSRIVVALRHRCPPPYVLPEGAKPRGEPPDIQRIRAWAAAQPPAELERLRGVLLASSTSAKRTFYEGQISRGYGMGIAVLCELYGLARRQGVTA